MATWRCGSDVALQPDQSLVAELIATHMQRHTQRLAKLSACASADGSCPAWWRHRWDTWRDRSVEAEHFRVCAHARIWGDFLPSSPTPLPHDPFMPPRYTGIFSAMDYVRTLGFEDRTRD